MVCIICFQYAIKIYKFKNLTKTIIISFVSSVPMIGVSELVKLFVQSNILQIILICIGSVIVYGVMSILLRNDIVIDLLQNILNKTKKVLKINKNENVKE